MKLTFIKSYGHIIAPADQETADYIEAIKPNEGFTVNRPKKQRNVMFHRKFFGMLKKVYDGCGVNITFDEFRKSIIMRSGFVEFERLFIADKLVERVTAKSISFEKMDEVEFEKVYQKCLDSCIEMFNLRAEDVKEFI